MAVRVHDLKTWAIYWDAVADGDKTFEVRKNDRSYQPGDIVKLRRWNPGRVPACYETRDGECSHFVQERGTLEFRVGAILQGGQFGLEPGYCVFSLHPAKCEHCGLIHETTCPRIRAIEYQPDGVTVKRIEFHPPQLTPLDVGRMLVGGVDTP